MDFNQFSILFWGIVSKYSMPLKYNNSNGTQGVGSKNRFKSNDG
jgi:hypothetical protein